jgi:RimJ/RimL family protein N-acetyltransferase
VKKYSVELRDIVEEDLAILFEFQREPEANKMADFPARNHQEFMAHMRDKVLVDPNAKIKTIVSANQVVGDIVSWEKDGKLLVGYWIGQVFWGQGIASQALSQFLESYETRRPLYAFVATHNVASIRVLEKSGFRRCGEVTKNAQGIDDQLMELVK